jgi:hypothetical protein
MSDSILRRTVIVGGAAALALSGWLVGRTTGAASSNDELTAAASNVAVDCEPTQQALVRQIEIDGEPRTVVQCVTSTLATAPLPAAAPGVATLTPAVYQPAAPLRAAATTPAPIRTAASPVRRQATSERQAAAETQERSWQKRALVIGGSAGAGAGIGALIGGKKGALIGAAIGGGSGTVYEVVKH